MLGTSYQSVLRWESLQNEPTYRNVRKLESVFGLPIETLLSSEKQRRQDDAAAQEWSRQRPIAEHHYRRSSTMPSLTPSQSHSDANASTGTSPPTWEKKVQMWCWWCSSVEELTLMVRTARGLDELAAALDVIREHKGPGVAVEVARCL